MAYTIQATPVVLSSIQGDLIYTVAYPEHTSDPVTYPNYKFVGDVYVGALLVARLKAVPNPVTNIGIFNIGQVVRNYIATVFNPTAVVDCQRMGVGEFNLKVTMKFGEEYSYTTYTNLVVDSERTFFNNYNGRLFGTLTSLAGLSNKPVTDRPVISTVQCGTGFNLVPYLPSTTGAVTLTIKSYNYSNTLYATNTTIFTPGAAYELAIINCSPTAINTLFPGAANDYTKYYTVEFGSGATVLQFNIRCECVYEVFTLHFLNKYGGFESKSFDKVSRKTISIEKKDFGKLPYTVDVSGVVSYSNTNKVYNESRSVYSSHFKEKMVLNSDLLTDAEYRWLKELVLSPMVYLEEGGYFFPVVISENNYETKKVINDELTNLTISIEFGMTENAQSR